MPWSDADEQEYQQLKSQLKNNAPENPAQEAVAQRGASPLQKFFGISDEEAIKRRNDPSIPHDFEKSSKDAVQAVSGFYGGEALGQGLGVLAKATGVSKLPGWLMSKAANLKRPSSEVGQELINQGVIGTKGMMQGQVAKKLGSTGAQIGEAIDQIPGQLSHAPVAADVGKMGSKFTTPGGASTEAVAPSLAKVQARAQDIAGRPEGSARELFGYKKIAQGEGYNAAGDPLAKIQSQLAQKEASGYGKVLEDAYANANPSNSAHLADLNKSYSALKAGEKGLNRSPGIGLLDLVKREVPIEAAQSTAAHGLNVAGKVAPTVAKGVTQAASMPAPGSNWSDKDEKEYQELKTQIQALQGSN